MKSNTVRVKDFEEQAKTFLGTLTYDYFAEGTGHEETLRNNIQSYKRYRIKPRYLRNVEHRTMTRKVLGKDVDVPIGLSPTALQKMAHNDGERGAAKAAQEFNTIYTLSSHSATSIEDVAEAAPKARKWLQCYVYAVREVAQEIIATAEKAGFEAIVLTVDFPVIGKRYSISKNEFRMPENMTVPIIEKYILNGTFKSDNDLSNPAEDWSYIKWLKSITKLPIVAKGILTAEDAVSAVKAGVSAIWVSNHGARQLDGVPSTIEALPEIIKSVGDKVEVYSDGGIRDGTDAFKALALGARMVFIGRPIIWGLAYNGEEGVKKVLGILKDELDKALAITGCNNLDVITRDLIIHESFYHKM